MEFFVAQSYSKNLGLYAERIGAINVVCSSADAATRSQLKRICSAYVLESTGSWGEDCGKYKSGKDWSFILKQIGMFSFAGLNKAQSYNMTNKWHVYMTKDGRISLAGLSTAKCEYLADAIIDSYHSVS
uniref:Aminotransferase class I/classII large domain-containing protein n=1 Tax=Brassica oleracea var. oleracea TaxID=109376 RepID=A0A0D3DGZ9_BRAOL